ncbi:hypothetical protein [Chlamydiifrater phoenicopteri]|uniref:hypothetical protein n=1 Tax=Chlamydiifrater phoenicopteri TaxID=2681469 RepID=UPI001BCEF350|nr:hypothetical protein [Chlamydiifrater phoenicopteri]
MSSVNNNCEKFLVAELNSKKESSSELSESYRSTSEQVGLLWLSGFLVASITLLSVFLVKVVGPSVFGASVAAFSSICLASIASTLLVLFVIGAIHHCIRRVSDNLLRQKTVFPKEGPTFVLKEGLFLSYERILQFFNKIEREGDLSKQATLASLVIQGGGFVKKEIKERLVDFPKEFRVGMAFPAFWSHILSQKTLCLTYDSSPEIRFMSRIASIEEENMHELASAKKEGFTGEVFEDRFSRELLFVTLGMLSSEELSALESCLRAFVGKECSEEDLVKCYTGLILSVPKIVALESVFLNWLEMVYPHILLCEAFSEYKVHFLNGLIESVNLLKDPSFDDMRCFSGIVPSSIASFVDGTDLRFDIGSLRVRWADFCLYAMMYSRNACFSSTYIANAAKFVECIENENMDFLEEVDLQNFLYDRCSKDFISCRYALWDLKSMCIKNPRLKEKIEEGLESLREIECLGASVEELVELEHKVLGLK